MEKVYIESVYWDEEVHISLENGEDLEEGEDADVPKTGIEASLPEGDPWTGIIKVYISNVYGCNEVEITDDDPY